MNVKRTWFSNDEYFLKASDNECAVISNENKNRKSNFTLVLLIQFIQFDLFIYGLRIDFGGWRGIFLEMKIVWKKINKYVLNHFLVLFVNANFYEFMKKIEKIYTVSDATEI